MTAELAYYLAWPHGQIWPNLIASGICSLLVWWRLHRRAVTHFARLAAQAAVHHAERLDQAERHADELKRQLTAHCADIKAHVSAQPVTVHVQPPDPEQAAAQAAGHIADQVKRRAGGRM